MCASQDMGRFFEVTKRDMLKILDAELLFYFLIKQIMLKTG